MNAFHRLAVMCLTILVGVAHAQTPPSDTPALAAARKRQDAIKSIEFTVRVKQTVEPNVMEQDERAGRGTYPNEKSHFESINRLVFEGNKIRFEDNHPMPHASRMGWVNSKCVYVSDGELVKFYQGPAEGLSRENCIAKISTIQQESVAGYRTYMPLHLACRGVTNPSCRQAFTFGPFTRTGLTAMIRGESTDEYLRQPSQTSAAVQLWVAPAADQSPRRIRYNRAGGGAVALTDITSERDAGSGLWLPKSWVPTSYSPTGDKVEQTHAVTVESVRLNHSFDRSEFDLTFPAGVEVYDDRTGKYTLSDGGSGVPLTRAGGEPVNEPASLLSRYWWVLTCVIAVGVMAAVWVVVRRKSRHGRGG